MYTYRPPSREPTHKLQGQQQETTEDVGIKELACGELANGGLHWGNLMQSECK